MSLTERYSQERAAQLLRVLAYDQDDHLFLCDDGLAFGFICRPLAGGDDGVMNRLVVTLNTNWPVNTLVQFGLYASPDISRTLNQSRYLRRDLDPGSMLWEIMEARNEFLLGGTTQAIEPRTDLWLRELVSFVTVKIPIADKAPDEMEWKRAQGLRITLQQGLENVMMMPQPMTAVRYRGLLSTILNQDEDASWRRDPVVDVEVDRLLRDQVLDPTTDVRVDDEGLWLGKTRVRMLGIKRLPQAAYFGHASRYLGDLESGVRGLRQPFLLTGTLHFPDQQQAKSDLETKRAYSVHQAYGPLLRLRPQLALRKQDLDIVFEGFENGERPVRLYLGLALFAKTQEQSLAVVSNAASYWGEIGFYLMPESFVNLPLFLTCLPFGAEVAAISDTMRYKTMTTRHAAVLLPIFGDWAGTGTPVFQLVSRRGQLMNMSLYDSGSNFNLFIAAASGKGKSFLANEIIVSTLSMGGLVRVIDVGYSYRKLCDLLDGEFLHFGKDSNVCLNPFPLVQDWEEEADMLVSLVAAMAAPTRPLDDYQASNLREAMATLWLDKGRGLSIDEIADHLEHDQDQRVRDIGEQLFAFTSKGEYGRYFNGPNTVNLKNKFSVLELQELSSHKHLQQCVLLMLMYFMQQEMYLSDRSMPKLNLIDESWDLLAGNQSGSSGGTSAVAEFVNIGYRRVRKYGGAMATITQGVEDMYRSEAGRAIVENSANVYVLGQKEEAIRALKKEQRLRLSDSGYKLLESVHTIPGAYSEVFAFTDRGMGIGRLVVDPVRQLLYSSHHQDVADIRAARDEGMTVREAINHVISQRRFSRAS